MGDASRKPTYDELAALVVELRAHIARQDERIATLEQELAETKRELTDTKRQLAAAWKNSRNSSKPPSSDIVKPPKASGKGKHGKKRRIGGQKGHPKHDADPPLENADHIVDRRRRASTSARPGTRCVPHGQPRAPGQWWHGAPPPRCARECQPGRPGHPFEKPEDHGKHWIWVFAAAAFTVFKIFGSRSTDALREVLGSDCAAIIGADFYSAYKCFMKEANVKVQFCWAHLIRDIKFLSESSDKCTANYGNRLLKLCRLIFQLQHRRADLGEEAFRRRMTRLKQKFLATGRRSTASGATDMVDRLKKYGEEYFLFLEDPTVEPTNNLAEREARHCVIDRRITQGTRGVAGQRWCERIWTVLATCARQNRDAFAFIAESVRAYYAGEPQPSLLPDE